MGKEEEQKSMIHHVTVPLESAGVPPVGDPGPSSRWMLRAKSSLGILALLLLLAPAQASASLLIYFTGTFTGGDSPDFPPDWQEGDVIRGVITIDTHGSSSSTPPYQTTWNLTGGSRMDFTVNGVDYGVVLDKLSESTQPGAQNRLNFLNTTRPPSAPQGALTTVELDLLGSNTMLPTFPTFPTGSNVDLTQLNLPGTNPFPFFTSSLDLDFSDGDGGDTAAWFDIDQASFDPIPDGAAAPEPSSIGLIAIGIAAFVAPRARKKLQLLRRS